MGTRMFARGEAGENGGRRPGAEAGRKRGGRPCFFVEIEPGPPNWIWVCLLFLGSPCLVGLKEKPTILGGPPQEGHTHFAFSTWFPFKNPKHKG